MPTTATGAALEVPAIHLNGTSRDGLKSQLEDIITNLTKTLESMQAGRPHGRDYYVKDDEALTRAQKQHEDRMRRVESVLAEYTAIYEEIAF